MLAIDQDDIVENYYNGHAVKYNYPACQLSEYSRAHYPFEQLSQDVQDLYGYDPDKAQQLLTEAGYPDGFECSILMSSAAAEGMAPVIKDFWEKNLNVTVNMDVKDSTVISSILRGYQQEDMYYGGADGTAILKFHEYRQDDWMNYSRVNDPVCEDMWQQISEYNYDFDAVCDIIYENTEYLLDQCFFVLLPSPESYYLLQPWLRDWNGEYTTGYYNYYMPAIYVWIDQDLRKEMTGRTE
jgi:ABC-type transport system substrate-binding protein